MPSVPTGFYPSPEVKEPIVPKLRTTWTIGHERPLDAHEDPLAVLEHQGPEMALWAVDEGTATAVVEIIE